jgi:phosphoglycolate phosphatase
MGEPMRTVQYQNFIFDLDGTLIDSAGDIKSCLEKTYRRFPELGKMKMKREMVGPPLPELIQKLTPKISLAQKQRLIEHFRKIYFNCGFKKTRVYPGVRQVLKKLQKNGGRLFVATNKPIRLSRSVLAALNLEVFCEVVAPDSVPGRVLSKTQMISYLMKKWRLDPLQTVMVGDIVQDIQAARQNGIIAAVFLGGYGRRRELMAAKPDWKFFKFSALAEDKPTLGRRARRQN